MAKKTQKEKCNCEMSGVIDPCETHNKPRHTPTPWHVAATWCQTDIVDDAQKGKGAWSLVAKAFTPENAEFIVRAVNSHEELLEAVKQLMDHQLGKITLDWADATRIKTLIAKAEGR